MARAVLLSVLCVAGCVEPSLQPVRLETASQVDQTYCARPAPVVDVLIVMDDSPTMLEEVPWVGVGLRNIAAVYERSKSGLDYRIGDVSSTRDDETLGRLVGTSCRERLDAFVLAPDVDLRAAGCLDACGSARIATTPTSVAGDPVPRARPWIESSEGVLNLPEDVGEIDDLPCRGALGLAGSGPRRPLAAMARAIERSADPEDAAFGFLRDEASLFVLFVTDGDDESGGEVADYAGLLASIRDQKARASPSDGRSVFVSIVAGVGASETPADEHRGCASNRGVALAPHRLIELAAEFSDFSAWGESPLFSICGDEWDRAPACVPGVWSPFPRAMCVDGCVDPDDPVCEIVRESGEVLPECDLNEDGWPVLPSGIEECGIVRAETSSCAAELSILHARGRPRGCYRSSCEVGVRFAGHCAESQLW